MAFKDLTIGALKKVIAELPDDMPVRLDCGDYAPSRLKVVGVGYQESKHGYLFDSDHPTKKPKNRKGFQSFLLSDWC
jgi:hypothetical protein